MYPSALAKPFVAVNTINFYKSDPTPREDKDKGMGKEIAKEAPKKRRNASNAMGMVIFKQTIQKKGPHN